MEEKEVTKADIKQFIRDVTSSGYYNRKIISLTNQLEEIHVKLMGVKSITPKNYYIENKISFSTQGINSLIIDEEKLILERDKYVNKINDIGLKFEKIPIKTQIMMIELYVCEYNHTKVANKYGYSRQYLYKIINNAIKKVLKN
ncbi:MAG: hypothetical protein V8R64_16390 [Thomasclavelia sp.]